MDDGIVDAQVYRHPMQDLDGGWIYTVEYLDADGELVKTEYYKNRASADIAMRSAIEKNLPVCR